MSAGATRQELCPRQPAVKLRSVPEGQLAGSLKSAHLSTSLTSPCLCILLFPFPPARGPPTGCVMPGAITLMVSLLRLGLAFPLSGSLTSHCRRGSCLEAPKEMSHPDTADWAPRREGEASRAEFQGESLFPPGLSPTGSRMPTVAVIACPQVAL